MEAIKTSDNVEFDVIYADGTRKRVHEGILFEVDGMEMISHNGTDRLNVLLAVAECALELVDYVGAADLFAEGLKNTEADAPAIKSLAKIFSTLYSASAEKQAIFRLGQMDMRESVAAMLQDAGAETSGAVRASLLAAADLVGKMEVP